MLCVVNCCFRNNASVVRRRRTEADGSRRQDPILAKCAWRTRSWEPFDAGTSSIGTAQRSSSAVLGKRSCRPCGSGTKRDFPTLTYVCESKRSKWIVYLSDLVMLGTNGVGRRNRGYYHAKRNLLPASRPSCALLRLSWVSASCLAWDQI